VIQAARGELRFQFWAGCDEVPAQPVLDASAFGDHVVAVISKQPDLHRTLVEIGARETFDALSQDRSRDRERVDLIGLARWGLSEEVCVVGVCDRP
jgi:hypothetical protein